MRVGGPAVDASKRPAVRTPGVPPICTGTHLTHAMHRQPSLGTGRLLACQALAKRRSATFVTERLIRKWTPTRQLLGVSGGGLEGDAVAECFELADVVVLSGVGVEVAVVVVGAEFVESGVGVGEEVPDDH